MEEMRYTELVAKYSSMIYRLALHDCRCRQDAEDVMQNVLLRLYERKEGFESEEHRKRWLLRVTVNECRKLFASAWKRKIDFLEDLREREGFYTPEEEKEEQVLEAVFRLPRKYRIPVYLYYYEEYSVGEIAELLKRNPSTIQTQLERARKRLKKVLEEV